jgi:hypothetical protein
VPEVDVDQTEQRTGFGARIWRGWLAFLEVAVALCVCLSLLGDPAGFLVRTRLLLVVALLVIGSLCGVVATLGLRSIFTRVMRRHEAPLTDDACAPIVRQGSGDGLDARNPP